MYDRELVLAAQNGDERAYVRIYRQYARDVAIVCSRLLGNGLDAEDAAQETFLRAYVSIDRFGGDYQLAAWLRRIAMNICLDHLRARSRTPVTVEVALAAQLPAPGRVENRVEEQLSIRSAMNAIQPSHGEALFMRAIEGLTHNEIADRLDISPGQAKSLLHRARCSFKEQWRTG
ncbi:MAG: polymerase sigma-70 factor, subfamily [Actinomycetota bacterium]|nr:polymerase sigma-70 factor, subfamily [Actinomycetota bacterium]